MIRCKILTSADYISIANQISHLLTLEFGFKSTLQVLPLEVNQSGSFQLSIDAYRMVQNAELGNNTLIVFISAALLITPLGYRIAGESNGNIIILSGMLMTTENFVRLLRHEIGHYFGLSEHLNCVMSPFWIDDHSYCNKCQIQLASAGVEWINRIAIKGLE